MKNWPDAKRFIFEDLVFNSLGFILILALDHFLNFLYDLHIREIPQPINLGFLQLITLIFFAVQFARSWDRWKYY